MWLASLHRPGFPAPGLRAPNAVKSRRAAPALTYACHGTENVEAGLQPMSEKQRCENWCVLDGQCGTRHSLAGHSPAGHSPGQVTKRDRAQHRAGARSGTGHSLEQVSGKVYLGWKTWETCEEEKVRQGPTRKRVHQRGCQQHQVCQQRARCPGPPPQPRRRRSPLTRRAARACWSQSWGSWAASAPWRWAARRSGSSQSRARGAPACVVVVGMTSVFEFR